MIQIKLQERYYEYDIYSLVKAFYPKEEIHTVSDFPEEAEGEISFRLVVDFAPEEVAVTLYPGPGSAGQDADEQNSGKKVVTERGTIDFSDQRDTKNRVNRILYHMLSERTKRTLPWGTLTGIRPTKIPLHLLEEGRGEEEIADFMHETYLCSDEKTDLAISIAKREKALLERLDYEDGYSLYVGIPFCPSRCLYCSFTGYPADQWEKKMDAYLDALEQELRFLSESLPGKKCNTIYIGGGTPTTLSAMRLDRLITMIEHYIPMEHVLEFTVEAGRPDSITRDKLRAVRRHRVDRISINPQTMNQRTLDIIGRKHTPEQIRECYAMAREEGFAHINMDLIVGLPGETIEDVAHTLEEMKKMRPDNLTVHSLAIKRAARLTMERDQYLGYPMENSQAHMDLAMEAAKEMGLEPYYLYRQKNMAGNMENVGFAAEGAAGIYNILIMEEKQTIMALGAGAACKYVTDGGRTVTRSENVKDVALYMERLPEMIERKRKKLEEIGWL